VTDLQIWGIGTKEVNRLQYGFLLARPKMVDGPLHHLLSVILAAIFKHGRRYVSKMAKFRKMSITYDKINLPTCKWAQIVPLKILHLLVCSLQGFFMLTT